METLTITNILFALLGQLVIFLARLSGLKKASKKFNIITWVKLNYIDLILGFLGSFIGIAFMDEITELVGISFSAESSGPAFHSLIMGFLGQTIIIYLLKLIPNEKTNNS